MPPRSGNSSLISRGEAEEKIRHSRTSGNPATPINQEKRIPAQGRDDGFSSRLRAFA
jgi:hypothetical protein